MRSRQLLLAGPRGWCVSHEMLVIPALNVHCYYDEEIWFASQNRK